MNEKAGLALLRAEFPSITGLTIEEWRAESQPEAGHSEVRLQARGDWFAVEFRAAASTEQIGSALRRLSASHQKDIPLLVVPYMGQAGREICRAAGVAWLDLSGNAEIETPSVHIRILGEPNRYKRPGHPESLFAPKSARAARLFLMDVRHEWRQTQLAEATGLSASYLSRLLPRYVEAGFIECRQEGRALRYRVTHPEALLDAWYADYDFTRYPIVRGHVAARSGTELLRELAASLGGQGIEYAATGLAAAWMWEPFAAFRTVTLYVAVFPGRELLSAIGFHIGAHGSNTWFVIPGDPGVFTGVTEREGVRCVTPAQTYLDLKGQPERALEARQELRRLHLAWTDLHPESKP
jgi:DNA-binding transcriptional ArsR family regulator